MSRDIREYEPKIVASLTKRQIIFVGIGALIGIPLAMYLPIPNIFIRLFLVVCLVLPFVMCAWVDFQGMHSEAFFLYVIKNSVLTPSIRKYKSENKFLTAIDNLKKEEQKEQEEENKKKKDKKKRKVYPKEYRPFD